MKIIQKYTFVQVIQVCTLGLFLGQFFLVSIEMDFRSTSVGQIRENRDLGKLEAVKLRTMSAYLFRDSGDRV